MKIFTSYDNHILIFLKELPTCTREHFYQGFNPQQNNTTTDTASVRKLCGIRYFRLLYTEAQEK
jgi:hypothetical protein